MGYNSRDYNTAGVHRERRAWPARYRCVYAVESDFTTGGGEMDKAVIIVIIVIILILLACYRWALVKIRKGK